MKIAQTAISLTRKFAQRLTLLIFPELKGILGNIPLITAYKSTIGIGTKLGQKTLLMEPFRISNSNVGDYTYICANSNISHSQIGKFCSIGPNLVCGWGIHPTHGISTHPMFYSTLKQNGMTLSNENKIEERLPITIGNDVFIGANVTILDGITIGHGAVIGAGAVVSKDIPPYAIAVGCPIKVLRYRFNESECEALLKTNWWDGGEGTLKQVESLFFNIDEFTKRQ